MHVYFLQSPSGWGGSGDFNIHATTADPYTRRKKRKKKKTNGAEFKGRIALLEVVFQSLLSLVYCKGTAATCDSSADRANTNRKINY